MPRPHEHRCRGWLWLFVAICVVGSPQCREARAEEPKDPPDLTRDQTVDRERTYNLGATGLRGWIFTRPENFFESQQGRTTARSRQILVTHVGAGTPADGVFQANDVILGVGGKPFSDDARKTIAHAIQQSERAESRGVLTLTRWRAGEIKEVQLTLAVLGTYSSTAPYKCPKSQAIYEAACAHLAREPLNDDFWGPVNGLALLATGDAQYLPRVQEYARRIGPKDLKLPFKDGTVIWQWGSRGLFLSEYYLLTQDAEVLPAIKEFTTKLARGQSMYGTFGHGIAQLTPAGKLHGSIPAYGPVNAAGLIGNLAIVMGKRCGVEDPEIDPAIERASKFFGYFVDKGGIPYGEHLPWPNHENNGKNAMAAVFFAAQGDKPRETQYFAKMVTASYQNREYGHTGQGFSYLWGALGANTGGPEAASAFFRKASWHFDLVRRSDGSFTYDGGEQYGGGKTDDNTYFGRSGYYGLSPTASYVLTYALPLKHLVITGKGADSGNWLTKHDVAEAIASGHRDLDRKAMSEQELIAALGDWSPVARGWAAEELGTRPNRQKLVAELITLAKRSDVRQQQGAAQALGYLQDARALPVLVKLLTADDPWLRVKAAQALRELGPVAKPVVPAMLKVVAETANPTVPVVWDDPIQLAQGELAATLFQGALEDKVAKSDPSLLYPAIRAVAKNPDGMARSYLTRIISEQLTLEDVQSLAPDLLEAVDHCSPADTMFANDIRLASLKALAKYNFQEGMKVSLTFANSQSRHGSEGRTGEIMKLLLSYGRAAQPMIPDLEKLVTTFEQEEDFPDWAKKQKIEAVKAAIEALRATEEQPKLRSLETKGKPQSKRTAKTGAR
jgi:HEAT repeat protein